MNTIPSWDKNRFPNGSLNFVNGETFNALAKTEGRVIQSFRR